jgi:hypothetical protein
VPIVYRAPPMTTRTRVVSSIEETSGSHATTIIQPSPRYSARSTRSSRAGNHRDRRDHENVDQLMIASAYRPRIDKPVKARRQTFDHTARLPSLRTGNSRHHYQSAAGATFMREPCNLWLLWLVPSHPPSTGTGPRSGSPRANAIAPPECLIWPQILTTACRV